MRGRISNTEGQELKPWPGRIGIATGSKLLEKLRYGGQRRRRRDGWTRSRGFAKAEDDFPAGMAALAVSEGRRVVFEVVALVNRHR